MNNNSEFEIRTECSKQKIGGGKIPHWDDVPTKDTNPKKDYGWE